jgi:hypothetical protein
MARSYRAVVCCVAAVFAASCKHTPSCEDAINKLAAKVPEFADPKTKAEAVSECIRDQWPDATRKCIADARDSPDLMACMMRLNPAASRPSTPTNRREEVFGESKVDVTKVTVQKFANEAFPQWARSHEGKGCPDKIEELSEYMDKKDTKDPWGGDYKMLCPPNLPAGVRTGIAIMSAGEDKKEGTPDDIKSWE